MEGDPTRADARTDRYLPWERVDLLERVLYLVREEQDCSLSQLMRATSLAASEPYRRHCRLRIYTARGAPERTLRLIAECIVRRALGPAATRLQRQDGPLAVPEARVGAAPV